MNNRFLIIACASLLLVGMTTVIHANESSTNTEQVDYAMINQLVVEQAILPDYFSLVKATREFDQLITRTCQRDEAAFNNGAKVKAIDTHVMRSFLNVRYAWAKVQLLSFGPISFLERRERFDFWPDKHRVGERQIRQLLSQTDSTNSFHDINIEQFREKSVAIQGLSAMERVLFSQKQTLNTHDCHLARLIAENLLSIAEDVFAQWSTKPIEFKNDLLNPTPDLTFFSDAKQVASVLLNDMSTQIRVVSDQKIANAMPSAKKRDQKINYRKLESWRTGSTFALMTLNILTVKKYYQLGFSRPIKQLNVSLHQHITGQFEKVLSQLEILNSRRSIQVKKMTQTKEVFEIFTALQIALLELDTLLSNDVVKTLGLHIKFNALDGD